MAISEERMNEIREFVFERMGRVSKSDWDSVAYADEEGDDWAVEQVANAMGANYAVGASKMCFIFDELYDVVVKVPFYGKCGYEYDDEYDEYTDDVWHEPFHCAHNDDNDWDYCRVEANIYAEAVKVGVADMLCGTWYLGEFDLNPVYVSERAALAFWDGEQEYEYSEMYDDIVEYSNKHINFSVIGEEKSVMLVDAYGLDLVSLFMEFIGVLGISDFHSGNFMFDWDGRLRCVDYSSYWD